MQTNSMQHLLETFFLICITLRGINYCFWKERRKHKFTLLQLHMQVCSHIFSMPNVYVIILWIIIKAAHFFFLTRAPKPVWFEGEVPTYRLIFSLSSGKVNINITLFKFSVMHNKNDKFFSFSVKPKSNPLYWISKDLIQQKVIHFRSFNFFFFLQRSHIKILTVTFLAYWLSDMLFLGHFIGYFI